MNLLKGFDYGLATVIGIPAGIYISSYAAYKRADSRGAWQWVWMERAINWLFRDPLHCRVSMQMNLEDIKRYYGKP